ncbi:MAG: radical SAM protein [Candidatus Aenigmatarchaeota archaeon]
MVILQSFLPVLLSRYGKRTPLEVFHEINFSCNLRCKYCGLPKNRIKEMSTNQIKKAIDEFSNAGTKVWNFTGGEPLLRKDIGELINYAKDCGLFVMLTTNGVLFEKMYNELKNIDRIFMSLNGSKEIHEKTKGRGTYEKVIESIKSAKSRGFDITIQSTICEENTKNDFFGLRYLFGLSNELGVRIIFHPVYSHKYGKSNDPMSAEKNIKAIELIKKSKEKFKQIGRDNAVYNEWIRRFDGRKAKKSYAGILYCNLLPNGYVSPCFFSKESYDGLKIGFVNAFNKIKPHQCSCISFFADRDLLYSLNFNAIKTLLLKRRNR